MILFLVGEGRPIEERTRGLTPKGFHTSQRSQDKDLAEGPAAPISHKTFSHLIFPKEHDSWAPCAEGTFCTVALSQGTVQDGIITQKGLTLLEVDFPPLWHPPFRHGDENEVWTVAFALHRRAWHAPDVLLSVGFLAPEGGKAVVPGAQRLGPLLPLNMVKFRLFVQLGTYLDVRCCTRWVLSSFSFYVMPRKDGVRKNGRQPTIFEYLSCLIADRI